MTTSRSTSWRGARVEHILEFEHLYPQTQLIRLEQNYRSTQTILDAANGVIEHNRGRKGKSLWTDAGAGEKVRISASLDDESEALAVIELVKREVEAGTSLQGDRDAVSHQCPVARAGRTTRQIQQDPVPAHRIGASSTSAPKCATCWRTARRSQTRPMIDQLKRIINVPRRGIGKATIDQVEQWAVEHGIRR